MYAKSAERILQRYDRTLRVLHGMHPKAFRRLRRGWKVPAWLREPYYMIWGRDRETGAMRLVRSIQDRRGRPRPLEEADVHDVLSAARRFEWKFRGKKPSEFHENDWLEWERMVGDDAEEAQIARSERAAEARRKHFRDKLRYAIRRDAHQVVRGTVSQARSKKPTP